VIKVRQHRNQGPRFGANGREEAQTQIFRRRTAPHLNEFVVVVRPDRPETKVSALARDDVPFGFRRKRHSQVPFSKRPRRAGGLGARRLPSNVSHAPAATLSIVGPRRSQGKPETMARAAVSRTVPPNSRPGRRTLGMDDVTLPGLHRVRAFGHWGGNARFGVVSRHRLSDGCRPSHCRA